MTFYVFLVKISLPPFPTKIPRFTFQGLFSRNCTCAKKKISQNSIVSEIILRNNIPPDSPPNSIPNSIPNPFHTKSSFFSPKFHAKSRFETKRIQKNPFPKNSLLGWLVYRRQSQALRICPGHPGVPCDGEGGVTSGFVYLCFQQ